jgi:hypothetical protein
MVIQTVKEVFLIVGAALGIIAFFKTVLDPVLEANKRRWDEFKERVDEDRFKQLEFEVWDARRIDSETLRPIECLVSDIKERPEYLRFGPLFETQYSNHLDNLRNHYLEFRRYVQTPYWEPFGKAGAVEALGLKLDKEAFSNSELKTDDDYSVNLERAAEEVERMRLEFRSLSVLSNLHLFEVPFAKQIVRRRSTLKS